MSMLPINGWCPCCGLKDQVTSGGCGRCGSYVMCSCGARLSCGCGRTFDAHDCPNVTITATIGEDQA